MRAPSSSGAGNTIRWRCVLNHGKQHSALLVALPIGKMARQVADKQRLQIAGLGEVDSEARAGVERATALDLHIQDVVAARIHDAVLGARFT